MRRWKVQARRGVVGIVVVVAMVIGLAGTAVASDPFYWRNNPTLCQSGCTTQRNLIRFWQAVLWADNVGGGIGDSFVDGQFGSNTAAKTRLWQDVDDHRDWNQQLLAVDGRVGPRTWYAANHSSIWCERAEIPDQGTGNACEYGGLSGRYFQYFVSDSGNWSFWLFQDYARRWNIRSNCQTGTCIES
ncbi:peptidoglycan-binding protein [Micromonospora sp. CPCC 205371]|nr:peptidoglycan-binding protein [Micromonospora sp. CPCC 205371]